ncbi:hypothetical protein A7X67_09215 [Clostridium sp. W14A]|nr:hypothetical protein A7X67_09215 [Clostridium sp. W14A]
MSSKAITRILFWGVLTIFLLYFTILNLRFTGSRYAEVLDTVSKSAQGEDWQSAADALNRFENFWNGAEYYVQFNNADQSFSTLNRDVENLKAAVLSRKAYETDLYSRNIKSLLDNCTKPVPLP